MPFTPDADLELSFAPELIPAEIDAELEKHGLHIRPLASSDYRRGHLDVLSVLTKVGDPGEEAWVARYNELVKAGIYNVAVIVSRETDRIVSTGTVFVEPKFIRSLGTAGHIEDIAVDESTQGKGVGKALIAALTAIGQSRGAYKILLDCSEDNVPFYTKCGYERKGVEMAKYT
ncbi:glucosamine-phosphate N-acetyltransferase [Malassezia cuniculi]|uniref:Glucosamine 6-phosphate N-acetyltransferase n=1 Tax=Malassezia cuniculi TaxID=948313 RepID=A0AAF0EXI3_9BASI|nr:glucosamine-phosphate N-acetyltransferase [Malassezia cuniculi]